MRLWSQLGIIRGADGHAVSVKLQQFAASDSPAFTYEPIRPLDSRGATMGTMAIGFRTQLYRASGALHRVVRGTPDGVRRGSLDYMLDTAGPRLVRARERRLV